MCRLRIVNRDAKRGVLTHGADDVRLTYDPRLIQNPDTVFANSSDRESKYPPLEAPRATYSTPPEPYSGSSDAHRVTFNRLAEG